LKGEFAELVERFKNGLTLERGSWSEAYAEGRCARAASGHATAALPMSAMKLRRLMQNCPSSISLKTQVPGRQRDDQLAIRYCEPSFRAPSITLLATERPSAAPATVSPR
jgi:hypothetical protein